MSNLRSLASLVALALALDVSAKVVPFDLQIVNTELSPDGFSRSTVVANGVFPGPLITGEIGDRFQLRVADRLTDATMHRATSIHWHGFFQDGTNQMDGGAFVNQCPIIPGHDFLYDFETPRQAGTFWYHSHLSTQYCDGLRGPFVVYDPDDPQKNLYDIDDESTVITLADWYHKTSTELFPNTNKAAPAPDSTTINGRGRYVGGPTGADAPLAVIPATPGLRHRFRIVSTSCFPSYVFSIDGHSLTVIEADGVAHEAITVDSLEIHAGQRYSVIVNADQTPGNYWIRASPSFGNASFDDGMNSAILRYDGAPEEDPTSTQNTGVRLFEGDLIPLENPGAPGVPERGGADVNINFAIGRDPASRNITLNGVAFVPPSVPVLLQILSGSVDPESLLPKGSVYSLPPFKSVEISIPGGFAHPFHLHGHVFDVVRTAGSEESNYENPPRRDVVSIGNNVKDNVTFRFYTDNPGPWFLHCHIDWHLEAGMAIVFAEDSEDTAEANPVNQDWKDLCPLYDENNPDEDLA